MSCESVCCRAATKSMTWMAGGPSQQLTLVTSISASLGGFSLFSRPFLGSSSLQPQLTTTRGLMGRLATLGKALQCCYARDFDGKWLSNSPLCKTCCLTSFIRTVLIQTFDYLSSLLRRILMGQLPGY